MNRKKLSQIFIYPIKSLGGISLSTSIVEERGLKHDRRWMLIDENDSFLTQRQYPQMALVNVKIEGEFLTVSLKNNESEKISLPLLSSSKKTLKVKIWDDTCTAELVSPEADNWFSEILNIKCRLVQMPESTKRLVDRQYSPEEKSVSFADGYPFLIIGQASLDNLNKKLPQPLAANRFRPNFVFTGGEPFEEDNWKQFKIGEVVFSALKPCARCVITTIDQETAARGIEPLVTLASYRKKENKVLFGMNLICHSTGTINLEDEITFL
ncbi:MAG: MOSC domain-containing protein [Ignavibacteriales bacterium]|nr:MOSC domain-containing protein [Ignavibacteriales bacterium]